MADTQDQPAPLADAAIPSQDPEEKSGQPEGKVDAASSAITSPEIPMENNANAKYGGALGNRPMAVSGFLQKRLQKGQKFFDSGDYNVAKSLKSSKPHINAGLAKPSAVVKRNLPSALLLSPNSGQETNPLPVLTPDDLPHHSHPAHEASKLLIDQLAPATAN